MYRDTYRIAMIPYRYTPSPGLPTCMMEMSSWINVSYYITCRLCYNCVGGGPRVVVSTAAFHARVRGSVPGLGGLKETKNVSSPFTCES